MIKSTGAFASPLAAALSSDLHPPQTQRQYASHTPFSPLLLLPLPCRYDEALERLPAVWETYLADGWLQLAAVTLRRVYDSAWQAGKVSASVPCVLGAVLARLVDSAHFLVQSTRRRVFLFV